MTTVSQPRNSVIPLVARALMAIVFIMSGLSKLGAPAATQGYIAAMGLPAPILAYLGAIAVEVGGGILLLVGYRTRAVAFVLAGFSVLTALIFHHAFADQNQMIHFLKNIAMAGGFLQIAAFGAGSLSLDERMATAGAPRLA